MSILGGANSYNRTASAASQQNPFAPPAAPPMQMPGGQGTGYIPPQYGGPGGAGPVSGSYAAGGMGTGDVGTDSNALTLQGLSSAPQIGDQYKGYLASARSRIAQDLMQSIGDINASEQRGQGVINTIPGELDRIYGAAAPQIDQYAAASKAAQASTGLQSFTPAGAGVEPIKAAIAGEQQDRKADVPLLSLGNAEMGMRARGAARMTSDQMQGQLDQQGANLASQNALAQAQLNAQYGTAGNDFLRSQYAAQQQHGWQAPLQNAQIAQSGAMTNYYNAAAANAGGQNQYQQADVTTAAKASGLPTQTVQRVTSDPAWQAQVSQAQQGGNAGADMVTHVAQRYGISPDAAAKLLSSASGRPVNTRRRGVPNVATAWTGASAFTQPALDLRNLYQ